MLPLLLPLLIAQDPAPPVAPTALETLQETWNAVAGSPGLRFDLELTVVNGEGEMRMVLTNLARGVLARPASGRVDIEGKVTLPDGTQAPMPAVSLLGTGEAVFIAEHGNKTVAEGPPDWGQADLDFMPPLAAWVGTPTPAPEDARFLAAPDGREGWIGVAYTWRNEKHELWLDPERRWRESRTTRAGDTSLTLQVRALEALAEVQEQDFREALPEGYSEAVAEVFGDPAESLLQTGAAAPDVSFIDLDGGEFTLSSLRGKTVLLNFWFYH